MRTSRLRLTNVVFAIAAALLLAGCVTGGEHLGSVSSLGADQMVVAGKIVLDPPLGPNEQNLGLTGGYMRDLVYFFVSKQGIDPSQVGLSTINRMYSSKLGKPFFVVVPKMKSFYYSAPLIVIDPMEGQAGEVQLPGGIEYRVPAGARAVSIGTIVYHRDLYNDIKKVQLDPNDPSIEKAFTKQYGDTLTLTVLPPQLPKKK